MPVFDKNTFDSYVAELGVVGLQRDYVSRILNYYTNLVGRSPEYAFIEDEVNSDGNREFLTVVLLTKEVWAEGWINSKFNHFYLTSIAGRVTHIGFDERRELDDQPNEKSRISVRTDFLGGGYASFGATGHNCIEVLACLRHYFVPNFVNGSAFANQFLESSPANNGMRASKRNNRTST